jgi:hypothetical protein
MSPPDPDDFESFGIPNEIAKGVRPSALTAVTGRKGALTTTPLLIPEWITVAAIHGTGSLLLGPHREGAQAIIPPAVLARTPDFDDDEYSDDGWRHASWAFVPGDTTRIDAHRPQKLRRFGLVEVVKFVAHETPEHDHWLQDEIELRARCLAALIRYADTDADRLCGMQFELDELKLDCALYYGRSWCDQRLSSL